MTDTVLPAINHNLKNIEEKQNSSSRIEGVQYYQYMDSVRVFALILGVLFHASLAYIPYFDGIFIVTDDRQSDFLNFLAWLSHTFRMPLFFVVAGFLTHLTLKKKGTNGYLKRRAKRLLLPLMIFLPFAFVGMIGLYIYAYEVLGMRNPVLNMIAHSIANPDSGNSSPVGTLHFWFIFYLYGFSVVAVLLHRYVKPFARVESLVSSRLGLLFVFPLVLSIFGGLTYHPYPAPESFIPQVWAIYFGMFYWLGWMICEHEKILQVDKKISVGLIFVGLLSYVVYYIYITVPESLAIAINQINSVPELTISHMIQSISQSYTAVYLCLAVLLLAKANFSNPGFMTRYFSCASYWIYVVHIPFVFYAQAFMAQYNFHAAVKFLCVVLLTLLFGILSYEVFVKRTPLKKLFG